MVALTLLLTQAFAGEPIQIVTGEDFTCHRDRVGTVRCWGNNEDFQLGIPNETPRSSAPVANGLTGIVNLSAGGPQSCAVSGSGSVSCWGQAETPAWGQGILPKQTLRFQDITQISVREGGGCARHRGGQVSCWDNTRETPNQPDDITEIGLVEQVVVGRAHACARVQGGSVWCWGDDRRGQLGQSTHGWPSTPVHVKELFQVVDIAAGGDVTCATTRSGDVWCWGSNRDGNLGLGHTDEVSGPRRVPNLSQAMQVSVGSHESCARTRNGDVHCWGADPCPRPDAPTRRLTPVKLPIQGATAISTGSQTDHKCVISRAGVVCWGFNSHGQALSKDRCVVPQAAP